MPRRQRPFWSLVLKSDYCWEWQACRVSGYGNYRYEGRMQKAHRISWLLSFGPIPLDMCVLHRCDNRSCVRPDHLFLGTVDDNNKDRANKGRSKGTFVSGHCHPASLRRGEKHWQAKLRDTDILEIKRLYSSGSRQKDLGIKFCIHSSTVSRIVRNQWRGDVK